MLNIYNNEELKDYVKSQAFDGDVPAITSENLRDLAWIEENKDAVVRAMIGRFIESRLGNYLKADKQQEYYSPLKYADALSDWAKKALEKGEAIYTFDSNNVPETNIGDVKDYLYALASKGINDQIRVANESGQKKGGIRLTLNYLRDIYSTWDEAEQASREWHEELARKRKEKADLATSLEGTEKIMDLPDNLTAYRLLTPEALDYEGNHMSHCVGRGRYDTGVQDGTTEIYSIRDTKGEPHVTFEISVDKVGHKRIKQCKGKENKVPVGKYRPAVKAFVQAQGFDFQNCSDMDNLRFVKLSNCDIVSFNRKRNDCYFGDGFYVKNGEKFDIEGHQFICEDVILDPKEKQIINPVDLPLGDCLPEELSHIKQLTVRDKDGITTVQADGADFLRIKEDRLIEAKLRHVTEIGEGAFRYCSFLTSVDIPEGVIEIGKSAFYGCSSLTNVDIPQGVERIGDCAFYGCSALTSVVIPEGVETIGESAFDGCSSLTNVVIPEGVKEIGNWAFCGCYSLTSVDIPEGVERIGDNAFCGCSSLKEVVIPKGVERIGRSAFEDCSSLTNVVIPDGVKEIGKDAFKCCSSLTSVDIPEGVTEIGERAFLGCSSLTNVDIPKGVETIGYGAFCWCSSLTSVNIPEGVKIIGTGAFSCCSSLTSVVIPDGVTEIRQSAFDGCSSLTSVVIPEGVTEIREHVFKGCSSLKEVVIPEGVTEIGNYAFCRCSSLTSINIPEGVKEIGHYAFSDCSSLTSVNIPQGVKRIGERAFDDCSSDLIITCVTEEQKELVKNSGFEGEIRIQPQRVAEQSKLHPAQQTRSL